MTDHITEHYQGMLQITNRRPQVTGAMSATQEELADMDEGQAWSRTATERVYNAGGNEPGHMTAGSSQQE